MAIDRVSEQAAALVAYEYRTMLKTAEVLEDIDITSPADDEWDEDHELEMRVYLEAFLVHYRNLLDFLSPRKSLRRRDITAGPFIGTPRGYCLPHVPTEYRADIDKRLSHISTERGNGQQEWEGSLMRDKLLASYEAFVSMLDEERKRWFANPVQVNKNRRPSFYQS